MLPAHFLLWVPGKWEALQTGCERQQIKLSVCSSYRMMHGRGRDRLLREQNERKVEAGREERQEVNQSRRGPCRARRGLCSALLWRFTLLPHLLSKQNSPNFFPWCNSVVSKRTGPRGQAMRGRVQRWEGMWKWGLGHLHSGKAFSFGCLSLPRTKASVP